MADGPSLAIGSTLAQYRLTRFIDEGSFGKVFEAEHLHLPQRVAIKVMKSESASDPEMRDKMRVKFFREARMAFSVKHKRIVELIDVAEDRGTVFAVMEFLAGESLAKRLQRQRIPLIPFTFRVALHAAEGLQFAHEKGLIHRDFKPANFFLQESDEPHSFNGKLVDFGLATQLGDGHTTSAGIKGSPHYLSPEQIDDKFTLDARTDLWSFGVMLYEMLAGRRPFEVSGGATIYALLYQITNHTPKPILSLNPEAPVPLVQLVEALLQKDRNGRLGSAREVIERLEEFDRASKTKELEKAREEAEKVQREEEENKKLARQKVNQQIQEWLKQWGNSDQPEIWIRSQPNFQWDDSSWERLLGEIEVGISTLIGKKMILSDKVRGQIGVHVERLRDRIKEQAEQEASRLEKARLAAEEKKRIMLPPSLLDCTARKGADSGRMKLVQPEWATHLGLKVTEMVDLGNGVNMEFVLIPPGKFWMGSPDTERERDDDEGPMHVVTLTKPFYIGKYQVTQEEYVQLTGLENPSHFKTEKNWQRLPVENVSWNDAKAAVEKLSSKKLPKGFSRCGLPTEAQWEYACRAGTRTAFHFGDVLNGTEANYGRSIGKTTTVGKYQPNAFGLYDMHGNVWEWCWDAYSVNLYKDAERTDPLLTEGSDRVDRGGGWHFVAGYCRSAGRYGVAPSVRCGYLGFRLALVP